MSIACATTPTDEERAARRRLRDLDKARRAADRTRSRRARERERAHAKFQAWLAREHKLHAAIDNAASASAQERARLAWSAHWQKRPPHPSERA